MAAQPGTKPRAESFGSTRFHSPVGTAWCKGREPLETEETRSRKPLEGATEAETGRIVAPTEDLPSLDYPFPFAPNGAFSSIALPISGTRAPLQLPQVWLQPFVRYAGCPAVAGNRSGCP